MFKKLRNFFLIAKSLQSFNIYFLIGCTQDTTTIFFLTTKNLQSFNIYFLTGSTQDITTTFLFQKKRICSSSLRLSILAALYISFFWNNSDIFYSTICKFKRFAEFEL